MYEIGVGEKILEVAQLRTAFSSEKGEIVAVDGVSLKVLRGKTLGIVGESGSGKTVTGLSIMRLIQGPAGRIIGGQVWYKGKDLLQLSPAEIRKIRGRDISMIFQEPMTALNPVFTVGNQICEAIRCHQAGISGRQARDQAIEILRLVGMPDPGNRIRDYPHQLSGGMRQRVMIAMALSCRPSVLIADEPTTALDMTIQAQVLELLRTVQRETGLGMILITHDLGVIAELADEVAVMYAGKIVEYGPTGAVLANPRMPYTRALLKSVPVMGKLNRLEPIPGMVPDLSDLPRGCRFQARCLHVEEICRLAEPELKDVSGVAKGGHWVRCVRSS